MSSPYRDVTPGDLKECRLQVKDLNQQLRDQKHHNVLLKTENDRLKAQLSQLRDRLTSLEAGKPTKHGEAATIGALRMAASEAKQKQQVHGQEMDRALQEQQQLLSHLADLQQQLAGCQQQLSDAQTGWANTRQDLNALQQQSDELELKLVKLQEQLTGCDGELATTKQSLADSQAACVKAEGLRQQLAHQVEQLQQAGKGAALQRQQELTSAAEEQQVKSQQLGSLEEQHAQLGKQLATQQAEAARLQTFLDSLRQLAASTQQPVNAPAPCTQPLQGGLQPVRSRVGNCNSNDSNVACSNLQLTLHAVTISPEPAGVARYDVWCMLVCSAPGMPRRPVLVCGEPPSSPVAVNVQHQQAAADPQELLQLLSGSCLELELVNLKTSLLGGLRCPAPSSHSQAGQVLPMLLCAGRHGPRVTALHMFTLPEAETHIEPHALAFTASVDWRSVLPPTAATPRQDEFVLALRQLEPLLLESLRVSGLFLPGRSFTGTDGQPYQVWALQDARARKTATRKYLDKELEVAEDLSTAATPFATASIPLTQALTVPSEATRQLQAITAALLQQTPAQQQQTHPDNAALSISLRTLRDDVVAECQVTLCLDKDLQISGPLLQALLAPGLAASAAAGTGSSSSATVGSAIAMAGDVSSSALVGQANLMVPPLPGLHWAGSSGMAAVAVSLGRLLAQLRTHIQQATALLATQRLLHPRDEDTCQQAVLQAVDTCHSVMQQLPTYWSACQQLVQQAAQASSQEHSLAASWLSDLRCYMQRCVCRAVFKLREQRQLLHTAQQIWGCLVGPSDANATQVAMSAVAVAMPLPTSEQTTRLLELEHALLACYQQQHLAGDLGAQALSTRIAAMPGLSIIQGAELLCGAYTDHPLHAPGHDSPLPMVQQQASALVRSVQASLDVAIPVISHAVDVCHKQTGGIPTGANSITTGQMPDAADSLTACQQRISSQAAAVSSTLMQLLSSFLTSAQLPALGTHEVNQVLATLQVQLQVVWAQTSKVQPTSLPPVTAHKAGAWLKAALVLSLQVSHSISLWSSLTAYMCAQRLLLVDRQRTAAVEIVLEALVSDAVRAAHSAQARILELRSSKIYSQEVVEESIQHVLPTLTAHTLPNMLLPLHIATQCLVQAWPQAQGSSGAVPHLQPLLDSIGHVQMLQQLTGAGICGTQDALMQVAMGASPAADHPDTEQLVVDDTQASRNAAVQLQGWQRSASVMIVDNTGVLQPAQAGPVRMEACLEQALQLLGWQALREQQKAQLGAGSKLTAVILLATESQQAAIVARQCARDTGAVLLAPLQDAAFQQVLANAVQAQQQQDLARYLVARVALQHFGAAETNVLAGQQYSYYLADPGVVQPLLAASRAAVVKLQASLEAVQAAGQNSLVFQNCVPQVTQAARQALAQQQLQFEGLLLAIELYRETAMHTPTQQHGFGVQQDGSKKLPLPALPSRPSRQATPEQLSAAAAQIVAQMPGVQASGRDSTASEQEEQYVKPLSQLAPAKGRDWDVESDAASVVSTSTTGVPARSNVLR